LFSKLQDIGYLIYNNTSCFEKNDMLYLNSVLENNKLFLKYLLLEKWFILNKNSYLELATADNLLTDR